MSVEHCLACFDALDARLSKRSPVGLGKIQESYAKFTASAAGKPANVPLQRVADADATSSSSPSSSSTSLAPSASTGATSISTSSSSSTSPADAPLFVTWNTISDGEERLRGCIGTFSPQPLAAGIPEYAVISALEDTRFAPITSAELPSLQACVTLLTDFEDVDDPYDWVVGVHGVRVSFRDRGRRFGATYLPSVASEQGWDQEETMYSLVRKSGWTGSRGRWRELEMEVVRYQGKKASAAWAEYKAWKDWHDKQ